MNFKKEQILNRIRRQSVQGNYEKKYNLDYLTSKAKHQFSLTPTRNIINISENINILSNDLGPFNIKKRTKNSFNKLINKQFNKLKTVDWKKNIRKRSSAQLIKTKTFHKKFELSEDNSSKNDNFNNSPNIKLQKKNLHNSFTIKKPSKTKSMNKLEHSIKNVLNYMKLKIEERKIKQSKNSIYQREEGRLSSSPKLKVILSKKKKIRNKSFLIRNSISDFPVVKCDNIKRANSFNFKEESMQKIMKRMIFKISKNNKISLKFKRSQIIEQYSLDDEINLSHLQGFSFSPDNSFIFIFDIIIIFANLYSFIFIPLTIAKNEDITKQNTIFQEIIKCLIDIIYIMDFLITIFRGYYDHEMKIIRNNKRILIHYLKQEFLMDLIEAIPLHILVKMNILRNTNLFYGYFDPKLFFIKILMFLKSFKVFKILKKKKNMALEDLHESLSKNYYIESFSIFVFDFVIFFLFIHLFICLHIFFSIQSFPNWMSHIEVSNENFVAKYITSFYFLMTTMTTVGYGDIVCISSIERIFHIILLAIGTIVYTFLVSKIGNYLRDQSHEQIKLIEDLNILESIRVAYPLMPFKLYCKIKNYLLNISKKRKKKGISLLINDIPEALKNQLLFKIYSKEINEFLIFKGIKNSSFILQMLTNFITILTKKEEVLIVEGELIDNIIFVKDGRLVMEIIIDLNDPYKSIQKYLEINFIGISKKGELETYKINRVNTMLNLNKNYNDLKAEIDNIILGRHNYKNSASSFHENINSLEFGQGDNTNNEINVNNSPEEYEIIKILDLRKNEHFGEVHMFLQKPCPFTLKTKSRMAELLILRKQDAIIISKNYPNIWRQIYNKSYHNLVAIKKLTFRILKRYYNTNLCNKTGYGFKFDNSVSRSYISILERPSLKNQVSIGLNKTNNLNNDSKNKKKNDKKTNNKIASDTLSSQMHNSSINFTQSLIKGKKLENKPIYNIIPKEIEEIPLNDSQINQAPSLLKKKTFEKITFRKEEDNIDNLLEKKSIISNKNINKSKDMFNKLNSNIDDKFNTSIEQFNEILKSINGSKRDSTDSANLIDRTIKYINNCNDITNFSNGKEKIYTLEDIDENFSKRIRKKMKMRKKIEKLKDYMELRRRENNKCLIEVYTNIIAEKLNFFLEKNHIDISKSLKNNIPKELIDQPYSQQNYKELSQLLDSTSDEDNPHRKFNEHSLKSILSESFEIKSSYKNINLLSKGEIIKNSKYKKFIENLIKRNLTKNINYDKLKTIISSFTHKPEIFKNSDLITTGIIKSNRKTMDNVINDKLSAKKTKNGKPKNNLRNNLTSIINKKKEDSNKFELENYDKHKLSSIKKSLNENLIDKIEDQKTNEKNENMENKYFKGVKEHKNNRNLKNVELSQNNQNIHSDNKSFSSSINIFKEMEKDDNSRCENKLKLLNNNNSSKANNNNENNSANSQKEKQCSIF